MPARIQLALIVLAACAFAAVIGVLLAGRPTESLALRDGWAGAQRPAGLRVPDFSLRDQDGKTVTAASLRGHPVVFAFVYSTCRDTCPAQVQTIRGALDDLSDPDVRVVGVSVDPVNDNPKRAASFLLKQQMTGRMQFLLASGKQLEPIWKAFAVQPQAKSLEHSAHTVLADADGFQRIGFPFDHLTQAGLAHDLQRLSTG